MPQKTDLPRPTHRARPLLRGGGWPALLLALALPACGAQDSALREPWRSRDAPTSPALTAGEHDIAIDVDGTTRRFIVYVPTTPASDEGWPLLLAFHGGGGNMGMMAEDRDFGLIDSAERRGHVVAIPNGYSRRRAGRLATWNAGNCCGAARDEDSDDVAFARHIVAHLRAALNIDPARIYATGMSNGAMMAYRLVCEAPDLFSAIAAVAGTDNTRRCPVGAPVSVLHIHAADDTHVLFDGGAGPDAVAGRFITDFTSVPATIDKWRQRNGCPEPAESLPTPEGAHCTRYAGCAAGSAVQLCVTEGGGHSWPGGRRRRGDGEPSQAISANDTMWAFFDSLAIH